MALPTSGQLSLKDIGVELGITAGNQASLRSMSSTAEKSTPDSISEFYGYNHGAIDVYYGNTTYVEATTYFTNAYRSVIRDNQLSSQTISLRFDYTLISTYGGDVTLYWSRNSTSSWTYVNSAYYTTTSYFFNITNISYTDVIRIRVVLDQFDNVGYLSSDVAIASGTVTSGIGTVTPVMPFNWSEYIMN